MKKRSLATILVVTFALFISSSVISQFSSVNVDQQNTEATGNGGGLLGNSTGDVNGVYVPE
ncbi:MAG: hypothetical protein KQI35_07310 [Bacteroidetes bacterium]|nr:hypothetical protein [Bacteroidota bacterium]